jgi:hypothetical protein
MSEFQSGRGKVCKGKAIGGVMTFSQPDLKLSAEIPDLKLETSVNNFALCHIEGQNEGQLARISFCKVARSQLARPCAKEAIERWCELRPDELPHSGGIVEINLDAVKRA